MFVGHFAVAFAAKPLAPKVSLATLILAAALSDVLWIVFFTAGIEVVVIQPGIMVVNSLNLVYIPFSHSLLMDAVWGGLFAGIYFWARRDSLGAWIIFAAVLSHWILDVVTHRPDMPLSPGLEMRFGLGLWNFRAATLVVEGALWFGAIIFYARSSHPTVQSRRQIRFLEHDRSADGTVVDQPRRRAASKSLCARRHQYNFFRACGVVGFLDEPQPFI